MISPLAILGLESTEENWELYASSPELQAKAEALYREARIQHNFKFHGLDEDDSPCSEHIG